MDAQSEDTHTIPGWELRKADVNCQPGNSARSTEHPSTSAVPPLQYQWWMIFMELSALLLAALVQYRQWYSARGAVMGLFCVLTALMMIQADLANTQRQVILLVACTVPSCIRPASD